MRTGAAMLVAMLAVIGAGIGRAEKKGEQRIVVYMENGMAPMSAVRQAQSMAGRMFAGISIAIDWRRGVPEGSALPQERTLAVRIADKALENCSPSAMAASQPYEGVHIIVFYDRVTSRFSHIRSPLQSQVLTARLLAHVLVHEITHMLQGVSRHSDDGIMKAVWTPKDYRQMERRMLPFAPEDVERIHTGLSWPTSGAPVTANTNPEKAAR